MFTLSRRCLAAWMLLLVLFSTLGSAMGARRLAHSLEHPDAVMGLAGGHGHPSLSQKFQREPLSALEHQLMHATAQLPLALPTAALPIVQSLLVAMAPALPASLADSQTEVSAFYRPPRQTA